MHTEQQKQFVELSRKPTVSLYIGIPDHWFQRKSEAKDCPLWPPCDQVSGTGGPTEKIPQLVDHFTGPLVPLSKFYIRDSTHMINMLSDVDGLLSGVILWILDVTNLHTNIPHEQGIQAIKEMLAIHRPPNDLSYGSYITGLLNVVLNVRYFDMEEIPW